MPDIWDEAKLLILNYPNNPTGAVATRELFETAVRIGKEHHVVIVNDFAYAGIGYDEQPPISLLSTPGALDVSLELCSLSKMYMIAGWRGGFVAGNAQLMAAVKSVHAQTSLLVSSIVQDAGAAGLNSDQSTVRVLADRYHHRYLALRDGLAEADCIWRSRRPVRLAAGSAVMTRLSPSGLSTGRRGGDRRFRFRPDRRRIRAVQSAYAAETLPRRPSYP